MEILGSRSNGRGGFCSLRSPASVHEVAGFTLIELLVVVVIIALLSTLAAGRLDSVFAWKRKGDIRQFLNTWQYLYSQAINRGNAYRLVIDLDSNAYYARREVFSKTDVVRQVDYLANLRTKSEKERREKKEFDNIDSLSEEFDREDIRQSEQLETLYYETVFNDPYASSHLGVLLEQPGLSKPKELADGLRFRDVKLQNAVFDDGIVSVRLSPLGASDFAIVHFQIEDEILTLFVNPATGEALVKNGDVDFEWTLGKKARF